jgi:hypothetical protein
MAGGVGAQAVPEYVEQVVLVVRAARSSSEIASAPGSAADANLTY